MTANQLKDDSSSTADTVDINSKIRVSANAGDEVTSPILFQGFDEFMRRRPVFQRLYDYYIGRHPILRKPRGATIVDNMCRYGVDNIVAYIAGNEPSYVSEDGDVMAKKIIDMYEDQVMADQESALNLDVQRYGRAIQLVYHSEKADAECVVIDPRNGFVAFDESTDPDSVYGAVVRSKREIGPDGKTEKTIHYMDVYSPGRYSLWRSSDPPSATSWERIPAEDRVTRFTRVNLIEYQANADYIGAIQGVTSIQDALNSVLSDVQNDKDAFADTMLFVAGSAFGQTRTEAEQSEQVVKGTHLIQGESGDTAEWLIKQMDETPQIYSDRLTAKMHKNMRVPDFSDVAFAGNASGVALQYKLFGTEMFANNAARWFNKGFKRRCKLYDDALNNKEGNMDYEVQAKVGKMAVDFNYSTVVDPLTEALAMQGYLNTGVVSKETVMGICTIISDIEVEQERLDEEQAVADAREKARYQDEFNLVVEQNKAASQSQPAQSDANTPPSTESTQARASQGTGQ